MSNMLQQILEKGFIDQELLDELSDDQKQILFYKMRQEQIRKWKEFDAKMEDEDRRNKRSSKREKKKKVDFMKGRDGCDWVWVMGEHRDDKSIDQILEDEAHALARKQAEAEAKALREKEEAEIHRKLEEERLRVIRENEQKEAELKRQQEEAAALYQSIKEARLAAERLEIAKKKMEEEEKKRLSEIEEKEKKARRQSREIADSMKEKRSSEIYSTLQKKRQERDKQAEEGQKEVEINWKAQEKKSKEADIQMRQKAKQARDEYRESLRRSLTMVQATQAFGGNKPAIPPKKHLIDTSAPSASSRKPRPLRPRNRDMIISWFQKEEKDRGSLYDPVTGQVAPWFHGIIDRSQSERLLEDKPSGSFLIRVSERVWGYTLSFKEANRSKHFLIDASDLGYQFFGADQTVHESLGNLIAFHKENPITISGQEKLLHPCGQATSASPDYADLFQGKTKSS